jgi:hypothetical protein
MLLADSSGRFDPDFELAAAGGYVGVFAAGSESLLAYRDPRRGVWELEELARELRGSPAL